MALSALLKEKLPHLLGLVFVLLFTAALLSLLRVPSSATIFLCLVIALCVLLPLGGEIARKLRFYRDMEGRLDALDEKYLFSEVMAEPGFPEGEFLLSAAQVMGASMTEEVGDARRDMGEYREYIETWIHEVKTPIAAARLCLENHPGPLADSVEDALFQIEGYVEQALFYARSGAVDRDYAVRALPLNQAVSAALRRYAHPLIEAGFRVELGNLDAVVCSDGKWVEFILGQLISNSLKYRSAAPKLTFSQEVKRDGVVLSLLDNGPGIPPEDLPRVFDKGFTGANGRMLSTRSTGLGLYLCKKLCARLGLGLSFSCPPGGGTLASLTFPLGRFHLAEGQPYKTVTSP